MHNDKKTARYFNTLPDGEGGVSILLYGDIFDGGGVDSGRVVGELMSLGAEYGKIAVRINSNGGDVFSGIAIYNALRASKADITIYVDGVAASMAGVIALCGKPLYMSPYARLMLHHVSGGTWGSAADLRSAADMMESLQGSLAEMIAKRCGVTAAEVASKYFDGGNHWISAPEAVESGLADGVYDMPRQSGDEPRTAEDVYRYFNRLRPQPQNDNTMTLLEEMKKMPSFADMNESEMLDKVRQMENLAVKAEALEKANAAYREKVAAAEAAEVKSAVDKAVADGRITAGQSAALEALMKSDRANAEALLSGMPARRNPTRVKDFIEDTPSVAGLASRSWDELDKAGLLGALKSSDAEAFGRKYKERFGVDYRK